MRREFPKQDKPLFRWKLDENNKISKVVVNNYSLEKWGWKSEKTRIAFKVGVGGSLTYLDPTQLDRVVHGRIYSFTDDDEKAKKMFRDTYTNKIKKAEKELEKQQAALNLFDESNT